MKYADRPVFTMLSAAVLLAGGLCYPCPVDADQNGRSDSRNSDPRNITSGRPIPDEGYCDQPYVVVLDDGTWLCTMTTGPGHEGQGGQHIVSCRSTDQGRTWSPLVDIEPKTGPEASWVVPLKTPFGRIYGFYTYNGDRIERRPGSDRKIRADMLGWYCYKYTDDGGRTWSKERYRLPIRQTACDRTNDWGGDVIIFWGIDKPKVHNGGAMFAFTKLGRYMLEQGEGWLFFSRNILDERRVDRLDWEMCPTGEHGIRVDKFGSVQEEHNHVSLDTPDGPSEAQGRLYLIYRTTTGYPCHVYSDDVGRTWTRPEHMTYTPGGQRVKNPRACPKLFRCSNGKYLFWFHNHSGKGFQDRNPAWVSGGEVRDGRMHWSQPEILLYADDPGTRMSYPDLVEQDGRYWMTETQKTVARVHPVDSTLLEGLWSQGRKDRVATEGLLLETTAGETPLPESIDVAEQGGLTLDLWLKPQAGVEQAGQALVDCRDESGRGFVLRTAAKGRVELAISDGKTAAMWDTDAGVVEPGRTNHVVAIVDAGPRIISFVVNGRLCDGGDQRQFGWGRYGKSPADNLAEVRGAGTLHLDSRVERLRLYGRYLRTSEAVAHFHAGPDADPQP